jgi:hypothetical protein
VEALVEQCSFIGCICAGYGGALVIEFFNNCTVRDCSFENCSQSSAGIAPDSGGGGFLVGYGVVIFLIGLTFKNCLADRGIYLSMKINYLIFL